MEDEQSSVDDTRIQAEARMWIEDGQWHIELIAPSWVILDLAQRCPTLGQRPPTKALEMTKMGRPEPFAARIDPLIAPLHRSITLVPLNDEPSSAILQELHRWAAGR